MDKNVPAGAALLLDFIYRTDAGGAPPECYEIIFGNRQSALPKPITQMTLGEVIDAQKTWSSKAWARKFGSTKASSAAGAAQFMRATLMDLAKELHLSRGQVFNADFQDRLAYHLLKRRGYEDFMAGKITRTSFGLRLAQEWASLPVLAPTQGGSRKVTRGQSFYAGDGLNKSLVQPAEVEALLDRVKAAQEPPAKPAPAPTPTPAIEVKPAPNTTPKPAAPQAPKEPAKGLAFFLNLLKAGVAWLFSKKEH